MKKIFAVSDIHGYFDEMVRDLKEAGYDENNEQHLLVVCGDNFDRGKQSLEVYEYLKRLTDNNKAVVIRGNHDEMLIEYLDGTSFIPFNYMYNGTDETLADFLHQTEPFESWCLFNHIEYPTYRDFVNWIEVARNEINKEYPDLLPWLKNLPYYYETDNFIFTHGKIQGNCEDWRNPDIGWKQCVWAIPEDFLEPIHNTDKTLVVGHINCGLLRQLYGEDEYDNSIYKRKDGKVIGLDTCTILTRKVNVLVIEDETNVSNSEKGGE